MEQTEHNNSSEPEYKPEDLKLVLSNAFKACDILLPLDRITHQNRVNLSRNIEIQNVGGENITVTKDNIRNYIDYVLNKPSEFQGKKYNSRIAALSKWLLTKRGVNQYYENKDYYLQLLDHLRNNNLKPIQKPDSMKPALQNLSNTAWWLYCYHAEEFNGRTREGVLRLLVEIISPDDVTIYHYDDFFPEEGESTPKFCNYKGKVEMHNDGDKRYLFELKHNGERDLHILLYKDEGGNSPWLTGQYHNVSRRGNIISGKILFNKIGPIHERDDKEKAIFFVKEYKPDKPESIKPDQIHGFQSLPYSVKETFARKSQSFISVRNCFTTKHIDEWNRDENFQYINEAEVSEYTYEFFLSGPATLLPPEEYEKFRNKVLLLKSKLEEWYDCKGKVFTLFEEESVKDYADIESRSRLLFDRLIGSLRKSRVFIMLYHSLLAEGEANKLTGMLIEFGYCFHERKDCLVLWDKLHEDQLPNFIKGAAESADSRVCLELFNSEKGEDPLSDSLVEKDWKKYLSFYPR